MMSKGDLVYVTKSSALDLEIGIILDCRKDVLGGSGIFMSRGSRSSTFGIHLTEKRSEILIFTPLDGHISWYDGRLIKNLKEMDD